MWPVVVECEEDDDCSLLAFSVTAYSEGRKCTSELTTAKCGSNKQSAVDSAPPQSGVHHKSQAIVGTPITIRAPCRPLVGENTNGSHSVPWSDCTPHASLTPTQSKEHSSAFRGATPEILAGTTRRSRTLEVPALPVLGGTARSSQAPSSIRTGQVMPNTLCVGSGQLPWPPQGMCSHILQLTTIHCTDSSCISA